MAKVVTNTNAAGKSPCTETFWTCSFHNRFIYSTHLILPHGFFSICFHVHASVTKNNKEFEANVHQFTDKKNIEFFFICFNSISLSGTEFILKNCWRHLLKKNLHNFLQKYSVIVPTMSQMNPVQNIKSYFLKVKVLTLSSHLHFDLQNVSSFQFFD
jgi:hypothetical protein